MSTIDLDSYLLPIHERIAKATDLHIQSELDRQGLTIEDDVILVYPDESMKQKLREADGAQKPGYYDSASGSYRLTVDTYLPQVMLRSDVEALYGPIQDAVREGDEREEGR